MQYPLQLAGVLGDENPYGDSYSVYVDPWGNPVDMSNPNPPQWVDVSDSGSVFTGDVQFLPIKPILNPNMESPQWATDLVSVGGGYPGYGFLVSADILDTPFVDSHDPNLHLVLPVGMDFEGPENIVSVTPITGFAATGAPKLTPNLSPYLPSGGAAAAPVNPALPAKFSTMPEFTTEGEDVKFATKTPESKNGLKLAAMAGLLLLLSS